MATKRTSTKKPMARGRKTKSPEMGPDTKKAKPRKRGGQKTGPEPLLLLINPSFIAETDYERLRIWESLVSKRLGLSIEKLRKANYTKTYETCGSWEFDYSDVD
jgi:hypothetical protein